jgi:hypothetical protein
MLMGACSIGSAQSTVFPHRCGVLALVLPRWSCEKVSGKDLWNNVEEKPPA